MAAKEYNGVRYVRFIYGDKFFEQVQPATDLGAQAAISWWGADLDETSSSNGRSSRAAGSWTRA